VENAGKNLNEVICLAAGVAGYDSEEALIWVKELTNVEGLNCSCYHVNDAVIAHIGAFLYNSGIIAISGTGAIIFAINEEGRHLNNYNFHHYTWSTARHLSYNAVHKIIAGETNESDKDLICRILERFNFKDIKSLTDLASIGFIQDRRERDKFFGDMCPIITEAAYSGSSLAMDLCDSAIKGINTGIRLLGSCFSSDTISVSFIGSVINSFYIKQGLKNELAKNAFDRSYFVKEKILSSVFGAVIMAMKNAGICIDEQLINTLSQWK